MIGDRSSGDAKQAGRSQTSSSNINIRVRRSIGERLERSIRRRGQQDLCLHADKIQLTQLKPNDQSQDTELVERIIEHHK